MKINETKAIILLSATIPLVAAIILCLTLFDMRQLTDQARQWALNALGGQPIQSGSPQDVRIETKQRVDSVFSALSKDLGPQLQNKEVTLGRGEDTLEIRFMEKVLFRSGSAVITHEGEAILSKTGHALEKFDQEYFAILGHTDNVPIQQGTFVTNWELSTARACSVVRFLASAAKIPPDRFYAIGRGEYEPAATNDTEAGRAQNRRVEILVTDMKCVRQPKGLRDQPHPGS